MPTATTSTMLERCQAGERTHVQNHRVPWESSVFPGPRFRRLPSERDLRFPRASPNLPRTVTVGQSGESQAYRLINPSVLALTNTTMEIRTEPASLRKIKSASSLYTNRHPGDVAILIGVAGRRFFQLPCTHRGSSSYADNETSNQISAC